MYNFQPRYLNWNNEEIWDVGFEHGMQKLIRFIGNSPSDYEREMTIDVLWPVNNAMLLFHEEETQVLRNWGLLNENPRHREPIVEDEWKRSIYIEAFHDGWKRVLDAMQQEFSVDDEQSDLQTVFSGKSVLYHFDAQDYVEWEILPIFLEGRGKGIQAIEHIITGSHGFIPALEILFRMNKQWMQYFYERTQEILPKIEWELDINNNTCLNRYINALVIYGFHAGWNDVLKESIKRAPISSAPPSPTSSEDGGDWNNLPIPDDVMEMQSDDENLPIPDDVMEMQSDDD